MRAPMGESRGASASLAILVPVLWDAPALATLLEGRATVGGVDRRQWRCPGPDSTASCRPIPTCAGWTVRRPGAATGGRADQGDGRVGGDPACRYTPRRGLAGRGDRAAAMRRRMGLLPASAGQPAWQARLIEGRAAARGLFRLPYGDQAMFFRRATLEALGASRRAADGGCDPGAAVRGRGAPFRSAVPAVTSARAGNAMAGRGDCNQPVAVDEVPDGRATRTVGRGLRRDTTMLIRTTPTIPTREITDERLYLDRRAFIRASVGAAAGGVAGALLPFDEARAQGGAALANVRKSPLSTHRREAQLVRGHHQLQQLSTSSAPTRATRRPTAAGSSRRRGR